MMAQLSGIPPHNFFSPLSGPATGHSKIEPKRNTSIHVLHLRFFLRDYPEEPVHVRLVLRGGGWQSAFERTGHDGTEHDQTLEGHTELGIGFE